MKRRAKTSWLTKLNDIRILATIFSIIEIYRLPTGNPNASTAITISLSTSDSLEASS